MKSSTAKKTKKSETPRLITGDELDALTLHVVLRDVGWVVREDNGKVRSIHRTQTEAICKGRAMGKKRAGQLAIHGRNGHVRKWEVYWSGPIRVERKPMRPRSRPVNATRKAMREAMKAVLRERASSLGVQQ